MFSFLWLLIKLNLERLTLWLGLTIVYINNSLHLAWKYARIFASDIICSEWRTVFRERSSRKTVSYKEQIMSKDKYSSIFSLQMEAIIVIILQIFYATRAVLKIREYPRIFPSFGWEIFTHMTRLDQSHASENIWWIIISDIPQF